MIQTDSGQIGANVQKVILARYARTKIRKQKKNTSNRSRLGLSCHRHERRGDLR